MIFLCVSIRLQVKGGDEMQHKLLVWRKNSKLTQQEVADVLEIGLSTYRAKETGEREFTCSEMFKISRYAEKTIEELFVG